MAACPHRVGLGGSSYSITLSGVGFSWDSHARLNARPLGRRLLASGPSGAPPPAEATWDSCPPPILGMHRQHPPSDGRGVDIQGKCIINSLRRHILLRATNEKCIHGEHVPLLQEERRTVLLPLKDRFSNALGRGVPGGMDRRLGQSLRCMCSL